MVHQQLRVTSLPISCCRSCSIHGYEKFPTTVFVTFFIIFRTEFHTWRCQRRYMKVCSCNIVDHNFTFQASSRIPSCNQRNQKSKCINWWCSSVQLWIIASFEICCNQSRSILGVLLVLFVCAHPTHLDRIVSCNISAFLALDLPVDLHALEELQFCLTCFANLQRL